MGKQKLDKATGTLSLFDEYLISIGEDGAEYRQYYEWFFDAAESYRIMKAQSEVEKSLESAMRMIADFEHRPFCAELIERYGLAKAVREREMPVPLLILKIYKSIRHFEPTEWDRRQAFTMIFGMWRRDEFMEIVYRVLNFHPQFEEEWRNRREKKNH